MLSILIPTYNYNIVPLVKELHKQCIDCKIPFEIICIDDGSKSPLNKKNEKINFLENCKFIANTNNSGLSNNRNALAEISKYKLMLFIDGDSLLPDIHFVKRYLDVIKKNADIVYGGRIHPKTVEANRKLRWKYGIYREDLVASKRKKHPYKCTLFNNTLIKKNAFNKIGFEKTITQYGHEDTVFSYKASKIGASILHIDNPVLHGDVDNNEVFFCKTKKALNNLNSIYKSKLIDPNFITFLRIFINIKKFKLNFTFSFIYILLHSFFKWQLTSKNPSLLIYDVFRISYFCYVNLKKRTFFKII